MTKSMPPLPRGHLVPTSSALLIGLERPSGPCRVRCLVTHRQAWLAGSGKAPVWSVLTRCKGVSARRPGWPWTGARPAPAPALDPASARGRPLVAARGTGWSRAVASPRAAFAQSPALSAPGISLVSGCPPFQPSGLRLGSNCPIFYVAAASRLVSSPLLAPVRGLSSCRSLR